MTTAPVILLLSVLAVGSAFPANDPVISKWDSNGLRYGYILDDAGQPHLVDQWIKLSDYAKMARYDPDRTNAYHLYTRSNPFVSQPLVLNDANRLRNSHFDARKRTIVLMHGFMGSVTTGFNTVLVPAFLNSEDVNVIVLDWGSGSHWGPNAVLAAQAAARFLNWVNSVTGASYNNYHIAGYSVGGHGAGIMARTANGNVAYVTGLDPADRWDSTNVIRATDGVYTEIIHTSTMGVQRPLGHVDFFPNGGQNMPGCMTALCNHYRSYHFLAESVRTGGFTGARCASLRDAQLGNCDTRNTLRMGGLRPKTGSTGIFHLVTNPLAPFSRG